MLDHAEVRPGTVSLSHAGQPVADYRWHPRLPTTMAPRPYLHPVRTLNGTEVTEFMPADHPHHLGVSVAVPDVEGANFWGGRTFVAGQGPTLLPNHGTQRHRAWLNIAPTEIVQELRWSAPDGTELIGEQRRIATRPVDGRGWALDICFTLTNITPAPLAIGSPATNGRPGAGYGGFFWRAPRTIEPATVFSPYRRGEQQVHGQPEPWLALCGTGADQAPWTLVFVPVDDARRDRWFVRIADYPGVGSALAWPAKLVVAPGDTARRRIITVVADGILSEREAAAAAATVAEQVADADITGDG